MIAAPSGAADFSRFEMLYLSAVDQPCALFDSFSTKLEKWHMSLGFRRLAAEVQANGAYSSWKGRGAQMAARLANLQGSEAAAQSGVAKPFFRCE